MEVLITKGKQEDVEISQTPDSVSLYPRDVRLRSSAGASCPTNRCCEEVLRDRAIRPLIPLLIATSSLTFDRPWEFLINCVDLDNSRIGDLGWLCDRCDPYGSSQAEASQSQDDSQPSKAEQYTILAILNHGLSLNGTTYYYVK